MLESSRSEVWEIATWPQVPPIPVHSPLSLWHCCLFYQEVESISQALKAGLGLVSGFGLLDASKHDANKGLKSTCALEFVTPSCWEHCNQHCGEELG